MSGFTRQSTGGTFIAYAKELSRKPVSILVGDDVEQVRVHPEVYVQEYVCIKVKDINPAERGNGLQVVFDPASVPVPEGKPKLRKAITANTQAGGEVERALRWALDNAAPLYIGIEYRRKYRTPAGEVIAYDTPILELKGFDENGVATPAAQGTSLQNISKVLAVVGRGDDPSSTLISGEVHSDPMEWAKHRDNRVGTTPAEGWVRITRPDGTPGGAAITRDVWRELKSTNGSAGSAAMSEQQLNVLADLVAERIRPTSTSGVTRPPQRAARSAEGRRWDAYNSDGRLNPGSYAVSGAISTRGTALTILEGVNYIEAGAAETEGRAANLLTQSEISAAATKLMRALADITDAVQTAMTGTHPNRNDGSHLAAGKAVSQVATRELVMTRSVFDDAEAKRAWLTSVRDAAVTVATAAVGVTAAHFDAIADPTPINDASGRAQRESARQNPPTETRPSGPPAGSAGAEAVDEHAVSTPAAHDIPANRDVTAPATPNFDTHPPVESIRRRNVATIEPLLSASGLQPNDVMPLLRETFNVDVIDEINPENLVSTVKTWTTDPSRFREAARAAHARATTQQAAS